uniref:Fibroblast growth factor 5 n=1 Tax=Stegastes partitus TaxID=144197 RepID=A0A3B5B2J7_9TELE
VSCITSEIYSCAVTVTFTSLLHLYQRQIFIFALLMHGNNCADLVFHSAIGTTVSSWFCFIDLTPWISLLLQEWFTEDCKFRERFQENSYNTYASVIHRNHRTGREWFVALNKRGKAKMGSSPRVKSQHVSTHFLPRVGLHDKTERGFTITDRSKERRKTPLPPPPPAAAKSAPPKASVHTGTAPRRTQVKYWPKYRFG